MDTTQPTTDTIDSILSLVDMPSLPIPQDDVPLPLRRAAEESAKRAYHAARANGDPIDAAKQSARTAYEGSLLARPADRHPRDHRAPLLTQLPAFAPATPTGEVSPTGAARSQAARTALRAAGFAPADPLYTQGTRVNETGVENARSARLKWERKPLVTECCAGLVAKIAAEDRATVTAHAAELGMDVGGRVATDVSFAQTLPISEGAFGSLVARLGYGGGGYLARCPADLRATNVNRQREIIAVRETAAKAAAALRPKAAGKKAETPWAPQEIALRTRLDGEGKRGIFAAVSPSYTPFDVDRIAVALGKATPLDARGTVAYDGERARFEVLFHSTVQPQQYVAGEFFRAGVIVRADDTGGGAVLVSAVVWQNLCLNLIVIDRCGKELARLRHVGNVYELARKFEAAFAAALGSLDHFLRAWGYASQEDVLARSRLAYAGVPDTTSTEALAGVFAGIIDSDLIKLPRRAQTIDELLECWARDDSAARQSHQGVTRAAVVNAFTRWAHEYIPAEDPFAADEIERSAGALLWGRRDAEPAPLPFLPLEDFLSATVAAARAVAS